MKRLISAVLASLMLLSATSCGNTEPKPAVSVTASAGTEKYVTLFEERADVMPDSLVLATGDDAAAYGVDVSSFVDDEGYTIRANNGDVVILAKTAAGIDRGVRHITTYGNFDSYTFTYGEDYRVRNLTVMGKPIGDFAVVRPDDADTAMCYATDELVNYMSRATGVTLPVYSVSEYAADQDAPGNKIELIIDYPGHGDESFSIDVKENGDIDILCGRYRGALYGVYGLLEDIGWRFTYDGTEYVYESDSLNITEEADCTELPGIANRNASEFYSLHNVKQKMHIGGVSGAESSATYGFYGLVPKACHGLQNQNINWQGTSFSGFNGAAQPCFTDETVIEAIEYHYRSYIEAQLAAGKIPGYDLTYIDVSQYDTIYTGFCNCRGCMDVMKEEGTQGGIMLRMVNHMADVAAEYSPDIHVLMLAYCGTNKPPLKEVPRDNVRIAYAFYIADSSRPYICSNHNINDTNCPQNVLYYEEFEAWKKICKPENLQVWYYSFNCSEIGCEIPCFDTAFGDVKYLIESGIDCVMFCEGYNNDRLLMTALAELAWDRDMTEAEYYEMVAECFDVFYGDGGKYVWECIQILLRAGDRGGCWTNFDDSPDEKLDFSYLTANFDYIMGLFDTALRVAETEEIANRIEVTKARLMYACLNASHESNYVNGTPEQRTLFEERYTEAHRLFKKHSIMVFDNYSTKVFVPDEIDFTRTPSDHWLESLKK
ncbi:MAG: DUF4838 domain-containing protein [Ruminococcaceae bacterium]|nr:DUF4838 domain-containing protein [Oscillospiraceae bacterium]